VEDYGLWFGFSGIKEQMLNKAERVTGGGTGTQKDRNNGTDLYWTSDGQENR